MPGPGPDYLNIAVNYWFTNLTASYESSGGDASND